MGTWVGGTGNETLASSNSLPGRGKPSRCDCRPKVIPVGGRRRRGWIDGMRVRARLLVADVSVLRQASQLEHRVLLGAAPVGRGAQMVQNRLDALLEGSAHGQHRQLGVLGEDRSEDLLRLGPGV